MASTQSLNHLLNFTLPPRQTHTPQSLPRRTRRTGTHQGVWNKERFVNAQYRFVMNPSGDYTVHFADPDIFFQWHDILQVIIPRTSAITSTAGPGEFAALEENVLTCPICLSPPTAPRMTKCGHVFCFPCILHLLSTSNNIKASNGWTNVPMSTISTIRGKKITTLALPRSSTWPSDLLPPHQAPFHFLPHVAAFAKFMLATPDYLITDLTKDLDDLTTERRLLAGMGDDLGVGFIDAADLKVRKQIAKAAALDTPELREAIDNAMQLEQQIRDRVSFHDRRKREEEARALPLEDVPQAFLDTQNPGISTPPLTFRGVSPASITPPNPARSSTPTRNPRQRRNLNPPPPSTSTYYYYQAASGLPIFLHPLDIKILFSHFHSYAAFPDTITIRVESYTESTVNDDLRKRCKYLAHLPEGADVVFVEADLGGVVGHEGLKNFEGALKLRRARRKEKGRKDDKARARAEEREKEKLVQSWTDLRHVADSLPPVRPPSPAEVEEVRESVAPESPPQASGAWGARSFASAAHAAQGRPVVVAQRPVPREEDEYDLDVAWHELEQRGGRGGNKRRNNKLVVLGGGGRRAR
ncbi:putative RING finger protein P8B7.23 [Grifola frondosa]|uniref:Putative RING finger protein P8B7.23 n=1 Tax=Grifola frondosa TaxID=5627 RepID=A0A1C7LUQ7_GRIFR|nr:putative RING finger protein P8B7.23 [Grifola frondosa]